MAVAGVKYYFEDLLYRKILFSPLKKMGFVPEKDSEIFVSAIPTWVTVYDLARFFERAGDLFQIKLLVEPDGIHNRGIAFVTYMDAKHAQIAINQLRNQPFIGNKCLFVQKSVNNCRIFVGGLPTAKTKNEIWQELTSVYGIKNIVDVITYRNYSNSAHNRGFVFLEFRTHEEASFFRAKYATKLCLFGKPLLVDWSVPVLENDERSLTQVKILFLRNLNVTLSSDEFASNIYKLINRDHVQKVYKFKNYAFIHLNTRQNAEILLNILSHLYKDSVVEVDWAKPPNKFSERSFRDKTLINRRSKAYNDACSVHLLSGPSSPKRIKSPAWFRPQLSGCSSPLSYSSSQSLLSLPSNIVTNPHIPAASDCPLPILTSTRFLDSGNRQADLFSQNIFNTSDCGTSTSCSCPSTSFAANNQNWTRTCGNVGMPHLHQNLSPLPSSLSHPPVYRPSVYDQSARSVLNRSSFSTPFNLADSRTSTTSSWYDSTTTSPNSGMTLQDMEEMVNNLLIDDS